MRTLLTITGTTDGYGLGTLYSILARRFRTADTLASLEVLRTWARVPSIYTVQLTETSTLTLVRPDSSADGWIFAITATTDSEEFAYKLRHDFTRPGVEVNLKNVSVIQPRTTSRATICS